MPVIELWGVVFARTYFPDIKCQAEGTFSAIDQCPRERERDQYLQHQNKDMRSGGQNIGYSWAS